MKTIILCMALLLSAGTSAAQGFQGGNGSKDDPYTIYTPSQLFYFFEQISAGQTFEGSYIRLGCDLRLGEITSTAKGDFKGDFDGHNRLISFSTEIGHSYWQNGVHGTLFDTVSGSVHDLEVRGSTWGSYSLHSSARMCIANTLTETGHIYNCIYNLYAGSYAAGAAGTMAYENHGSIDNCYAYGTMNTVFDGYDNRQFGAICYANRATGKIRNCHFSFNIEATGYGFQLTHVERGTNKRQNEGLIEEPEDKNAWVAGHAECGYSTWGGSNYLTSFDKNKSSHLVEFIDTLHLVTLPPKVVGHGEALGELPVPTSNKTFVGWEATADSVVSDDMVLFVYWQNCVRQQPTKDEPTFVVDDAANAAYQWYYKNEQHAADDWVSTNHGNSSTSSKEMEIDAKAGMAFECDWEVSSEAGYDDFTLSINGTVKLRKSGKATGHYTYTFEEDGTYVVRLAYTKDDSAGEGRDEARVTNIRYGFPDRAIAEATAPTIDLSRLEEGSCVYCVARFADGTNDVTSDVVYNTSDGLPTGIYSTKDGERRTTTVYDLRGIPTSNPGEGVYIVNGRKKVMR